MTATECVCVSVYWDGSAAVMLTALLLTEIKPPAALEHLRTLLIIHQTSPGTLSETFSRPPVHFSSNPAPSSIYWQLLLLLQLSTSRRTSRVIQQNLLSWISCRSYQARWISEAHQLIHLHEKWRHRNTSFFIWPVMAIQLNKDASFTPLSNHLYSLSNISIAVFSGASVTL